MKISKKTFDIFKNFSGIRSSIYVEAGNVIRTVSAAKNIMAEAKVDEDFKKPFAIFDLGKFIATTSLFQNPEYQFDDKSVTIKSPNGSSVNYFYADEKLVEKINKTIKMPNITVSFALTANQIAEILKASSVLQLDTICIRPTDTGNIEIVSFDRKIGLNSSSNNFSMVLSETSDNNFKILIDIELLKMQTDDYQVDVGGTSVAKFTGKNNAVTYWIALRSESTNKS
jgi:prolyl oligopeptidase PreP (S9A serine peptidase family)